MSATTNDTNVQAPILLTSAQQKLKPVPEGVHIAYVQITVRFLDDTPPLEFTIDKLTTGQELLERVADHLQLLEKGYFGLRFDGADNERYWLDVKRPVAKQLKLAESNVVHFRVRYYPVFAALREEITRYQLFLQLRRDLYRGRLLCPLSDAYELAALILQSEVGDYDAELCQPGYVSEFPLLPRQNIKVEERISDMHKTMTGMTPAEAENRLLKLASRCDTYGVDPFGVRPSNENSMTITRNVAIASGKSVDVPVNTAKREEPSKVTGSKSGDTLPNTATTPSWFMGVNHNGVVLFASSRATHIFKWDEIAKLTTNGRLFVVHTHVAADIPTSLSFGAAPLAERDENKPAAAPDVATNGEVKANEPALDNGDGERRASQTKTTRSDSLRETKKEREEEPLPTDDKVLELPPSANRSATLRSVSRLSRISTLQRNSFNSFKQRFQQSNDLEPKTTAYEFRCDSPAAAKSLWLIAVDQQAFFTLQSSEEAKKVKSAGGLFARSAKFRFSGRCERELSEELSSIKRTEPRFERAASTRIAAEIRTRRPPSIRDDQLNATTLLSSTLIEDVKADESDLLRGEDTKRTISSTDSDKRTATRSSTDSQSAVVEQIVPTVAQTEVHAQVRIVDAAASANDNSGDATTDKRTAPNDQDTDQKREREHDADNNQDQHADIQSSSHSTARVISSLLFYTILLFLTLVVFFTLLYETEYLEQTAKRVVGVSLRKNIALDRLAQLTYKPMKQIALSLLKAAK